MRVVVGVQVDEPRRDVKAVGVDGAGGLVAWDVPMAAMTPSRMPMSPRYLGARVPSKIRPFRMTVS